MARRDIQADRSIIKQVARVSIPDQVQMPDTSLYDTINQLSQLGTSIMHERGKADLLEKQNNLSLELDQLEAQYKIDYQHDPYGGRDQYLTQRKELINSYGQDVGYFFKPAWNASVKEIEFKSDTAMQTWGLKQTQANTISSVERAMESAYDKAYNFGIAYANGDENAYFALADSLGKSQDLYNTVASSVGEASAEKLTYNFANQYAENFAKAVAGRDPLKAVDLLKNEEFSGISAPVKAAIQDSANAYLKRQQAQAIKQEKELANARVKDQALFALMKGAKTPEEMLAVQKEAGIPISKQSLTPKSVISEQVFNMGNALYDPNAWNQIVDKIYTETDDWTSREIIINDYLRHEDVPPIVKQLFEAKSEAIRSGRNALAPIQTKFFDNAFEASKTSMSDLKSRFEEQNPDSTELDDLQSGLLQTYGKALSNARVSAKDQTEQIEALKKAYLNLRITGHDAEQAEKIVNNGLLFGMNITNDGVIVPDDIDWEGGHIGEGMVYSSRLYGTTYTGKTSIDTGEYLKQTILKTTTIDDLAIPSAYKPMPEEYLNDIMRRGKWVNSKHRNQNGDNVLMLMIDDMPVFRKDSEIIKLGFDDIRFLLHGEKTKGE